MTASKLAGGLETQQIIIIIIIIIITTIIIIKQEWQCMSRHACGSYNP